MDGLLSGLLESGDERDQEYQQSLNLVQDSSNIVTLTPWLQRTKWTKQFVGKDMEKLFALTKKPVREEGHLYDLWGRVDSVLRRCFKSVLDLDERGWDLIPFWLASAAPNEESSKPFRMFFSKETLVNYISFWQRYICFCLRAITSEGHGAEFTEDETELLWKLHNVIFFEQCTPEEEEIAIMELSTCLIQHSDYASVRSSLIYFTGIIGFMKSCLFDRYPWFRFRVSSVATA
jgi:hypothetical protein